jgi:uncharacterized protein (TIGR03000 family)
MFRKLLTVAGLFGLAVAGLVLAAGQSVAQQGWQFYGGAGKPGYNAPAAAGYTYTGGYGSIDYAPSFPYRTPVFPDTSYAYGAPVYYAPSYSYGNFSPEQPAGYYGSADVANAAVIDVRLPARAVILFGGQKTTSNGPERRFISPPLNPGKEYVYEVSVRWQEEGREVTRTRSLTVRAGARVSIAFGAETRQ